MGGTCPTGVFVEDGEAEARPDVAVLHRVVVLQRVSTARHGAQARVGGRDDLFELPGEHIGFKTHPFGVGFAPLHSTGESANLVVFLTQAGGCLLLGVHTGHDRLELVHAVGEKT